MGGGGGGALAGWSGGNPQRNISFELDPSLANHPKPIESVGKAFVCVLLCVVAPFGTVWDDTGELLEDLVESGKS